jgi:peptide-methionine (S)-S-oxide reductase
MHLMGDIFCGTLHPMTKSLVLAGGCFWCVEHDMQKAKGVLTVVSGYSGGSTTSPTYENHRGHKEAILVEYDDLLASYKKLLQFFIDHIDPTDDDGQFADRGESYIPAIFYENESERSIAEDVIRELNDSGVYTKKVDVQIFPRKEFYKAEDYHQDYAKKNPLHYSLYREGSGREGFVNRTCAIREEKHIIWSE